MGTVAGWVVVSLTGAGAPLCGLSICCTTSLSCWPTALAICAARSGSVSLTESWMSTVSSGLVAWTWPARSATRHGQPQLADHRLEHLRAGRHLGVRLDPLKGELRARQDVRRRVVRVGDADELLHLGLVDDRARRVDDGRGAGTQGRGEDEQPPRPAKGGEDVRQVHGPASGSLAGRSLIADGLSTQSHRMVRLAGTAGAAAPIVGFGPNTRCPRQPSAPSVARALSPIFGAGIVIHTSPELCVTAATSPAWSWEIISFTGQAAALQVGHERPLERLLVAVTTARPRRGALGPRPFRVGVVRRHERRGVVPGGLTAEGFAGASTRPGRSRAARGTTGRCRRCPRRAGWRPSSRDRSAW